MAETFIFMPFTFAYGLFGFVLLVVIQIGIWRLLQWRFGKVRRMIPLMFFIFLILPLAGLGITGELAGTVLILSISLGYILAFPAVVAKSPSLEILLLVDAHKNKGGITREKILYELASEGLLKDRITDLAQEGLIEPNTQEIKPKRIGHWVGAFFYYYRKLMDLSDRTG